jgi:hypothetical protein
VDTVFQVTVSPRGKRSGQAAPSARPVTKAIATRGAPFGEFLSETQTRLFVDLYALGGNPPNGCQLGQWVTVVNHLETSNQVVLGCDNERVERRAAWYCGNLAHFRASASKLSAILFGYSLGGKEGLQKLQPFFQFVLIAPPAPGVESCLYLHSLTMGILAKKANVFKQAVKWGHGCQAQPVGTMIRF